MDKVKAIMSSDPVLKLPDYGQGFVLTIEVSGSTVASVLEQEHEAVLFPVAYYSRKLRASELNYTRVEKSALGIVVALDHFRYIVYGYPITIRCEAKALEFIIGIRDGNSRLSGWSTKIMKYMPYITNLLPGQPTWAGILAGEDSDEIVEDGDMLCPTVYTDGCCLANGTTEAKAGIGVFWGDENKLNISCAILDRSSNNRAEILAVCLAVLTAVVCKFKKIQLYTDSKYVISCMQEHLEKWHGNGWLNNKGKEIVNGAEFRLLWNLTQFIEVQMAHVSAHSGIYANEQANRLAMEGASSENGVDYNAYVQTLLTSERVMEHEVHVLATRSDTVVRSFDIRVLREAQESDKELNKIRCEITYDNPVVVNEGIHMYNHVSGLVYAKGNIRLNKHVILEVDAPYLPVTLRRMALDTYHSSAWACHPGYVQTCRNLIGNFFWASFRSDVQQYLGTCDSCQKTNSVRRRAPIQHFWKPGLPFQEVSMDVVGPLIKTKRGNSYVLNIIDIFSRYLISIPLPDQRTHTILRALAESLLSRFGCPEVILTDQGSNFQSDLFNKCLSMFHIKHNVTGPYRPQTNGLVERVNRSVKEKLTHLNAIVQEDWDNHMHYMQFASNNSYHQSVMHTPNDIIFGKSFDFPTEFLDHEPVIKLKLASQDYFDELQGRLKVVFKQVYENESETRRLKLESANKGRKLQRFEEGDLVLYKTPVRTKNTKKGFRHRYQGPFRVKRQVSQVSYDIGTDRSTEPGHRVIRTHVDRLKGYISRPDGVNSETNEGLQNNTSNSEPEDTLPHPIRNQVNPDTDNLTQRDMVVDEVGSEVIVPVGKSQKELGITESSSCNTGHTYNTRSKGKVGNDVYHKYTFSRGRLLPM